MHARWLHACARTVPAVRTRATARNPRPVRKPFASMYMNFRAYVCTERTVVVEQTKVGRPAWLARGGFYRNLRSGSTWAHHRIRRFRFGLGFALVTALVVAVFALVFALVFAVLSAGPQAVSRAPRSTGEQLGQPGTGRDNTTSAETTCRDNLPRT